MRRPLLVLVLLAAALAASAPARAADDPIVGTWTLGKGAIRVAAAAGGFAGVVTTAITFGSGSRCAAHPVGQRIWQLTGSAGSYAGTHMGYSASCADQTLSATWTLTGDTLRVVIALEGGGQETWDLARTKPAATGAGCSTTAKVPVNLSGLWQGDASGVYYLRQLGDCLWWYGVAGRGTTPDRSPLWSHVLYGQVLADQTVTGRWADVPLGRLRNAGTLTLAVSRGKHGELYLDRRSQTGGFGETHWKRVRAG